MTSKKDTSNCPVCDRFIGTELVCPFCEIKTRNFKARMLMLSLAVATAILGIVYLTMYAVFQEDRFTPIGSITKMMNYATISVEGTIKTNPYKVADSNKDGYIEYFSFILKDGKDEIRIAYSPKPKLSILESDVPNQGDKINVLSGSVGIGKTDNKPRIYIKNIKQIKYSD
ncbi:MAG: hypothetical protein PF692_07320 [Kiritimatiellae bacterium]|jgi:hypothetical protein|nr:hypothetical protein [Kiritimatiellia bacterium]